MNKSIFDFNFIDIEGNEISFEAFRGKKILIVNVASRCGFTSQYQQLQELYDHYKENIEIIAFPCNDFGGQEPEDEVNIKQFCTMNYGVNFTVTSKINIKSQPVNDIYSWLCNKSENKVMDSEVSWNFQKYFLDENGSLINVFSSATSPFNDQIMDLLSA